MMSNRIVPDSMEAEESANDSICLCFRYPEGVSKYTIYREGLDNPSIVQEEGLENP